MKTKICLCALFLSHSVPAALIDFNDIAIGTEVGSLNPYDAVVISTRFWVTQGETLVAESFTRGAIDVVTGWGNDSPSVVMQAGPADAQWGEHQRWNIEIGASFQAPISTFSVDIFSRTYGTDLIYSGVNDMGETFTSSAHVSQFYPFTHFDIAAPTGGYLTGFYFSQFEDTGSIVLALDNLNYTVPETIGLPTFVFTICAVLFVHRQMKGAPAQRGNKVKIEMRERPGKGAKPFQASHLDQ
jgi:hypothetical protein